jgi:hypothetical protein
MIPNPSHSQDSLEHEGPTGKAKGIHTRDQIEAILVGMPSGSPVGAIVRLMWATLERLGDAFDPDGHLRESASFNWEDEVQFEAMLDLLAPGVLKRIAAGLAEDRP